MDFDPAAFGLPSGFGAQPKSKPKVDLSKTKRAEEEGKGSAEDTNNNAAANLASHVVGGRSGRDDTEDNSREEPEAGPSDLSRKPRPDYENGKDNEDEDEEEEDEDGTLEDPTKYFPMSHEIVLKDHTKAVTALAVDPPGARVITGGYDYDVKMWDFGGMRGDFKPFKSFEPYENYHVSVASNTRAHETMSTFFCLTFWYMRYRYMTSFGITMDQILLL